jgi:hypothetical protein
MTPNPATTNDLAELHSLKINVHKQEFIVPASLASLSFGIYKK